MAVKKTAQSTRMQSPVGIVTKPLPSPIPKEVLDLVDADKFNPFINSTQPVLLPDPSTWKRSAPVQATSQPPAQQPAQAVPATPSPVGIPKWISDYQPKAMENYNRTMAEIDKHPAQLRDYSEVHSPEWTFNDAPPELKDDNFKKTNPVATDIALAMMGLGGLLGNSDYAIQAGTNFLGNASKGAQQADKQDFQSRAGLYDDQMKAAGIRYQRDSDRAMQLMRSIDASNAKQLSLENSSRDRAVRQYGIDSNTDVDMANQVSRQRAAVSKQMVDLINSGRIKDMDAASLNGIREFLAGADASGALNLLTGVSPDKQAQLDWATADAGRRLEIAKVNRDARITAAEKLAKSHENIASMRSTTDLMRQYEISNSKKEVAEIMAEAKKVGAQNGTLDLALKQAQTAVTQHNAEVARAQNALNKAAQQINVLRGKKDFIDNSGTSMDGLTPAGRIAVEGATSDYQLAMEALSTAENKLNAARSFYQQTYNAYAQAVQTRTGQALPPAPAVQDEQNTRDKILDEIIRGLTIGGGAPPPATGGNPTPGKKMPNLPGQPPKAQKNPYAGLTADKYNKMSPAEQGRVPEDIVFKLMTGG